jgi:hypothetical protein
METILSPTVKPGKYNVICKYVSYANKLIKDIDVVAGETVTVNFSMEEPQGDTLGEVTITATLNKENVNYTICDAKKQCIRK